MSECLHKPKLLLIIDLLPFANLLELLAIKGGVFLFLVEALPCSSCFTTCMGAHLPAVE